MRGAPKLDFIFFNTSLTYLRSQIHDQRPVNFQGKNSSFVNER